MEEKEARRILETYADMILMAKLEKTINMDVLTVEKFSNGFTFQNAEIFDMSDYNEDGADLADASGVDVTYTKNGMADIYLDVEPVSTIRNEKIHLWRQGWLEMLL